MLRHHTPSHYEISFRIAPVILLTRNNKEIETHVAERVAKRSLGWSQLTINYAEPPLSVAELTKLTFILSPKASVQSFKECLRGCMVECLCNFFSFLVRISSAEQNAPWYGNSFFKWCKRSPIFPFDKLVYNHVFGQYLVSCHVGRHSLGLRTGSAIYRSLFQVTVMMLKNSLKIKNNNCNINYLFRNVHYRVNKKDLYSKAN